MDPDAALAEIRTVVRNVDTVPPEAAPGVLSELCDRIDGLDQWLTGGGFLPDPWASGCR